VRFRRSKGTRCRTGPSAGDRGRCTLAPPRPRGGAETEAGASALTIALPTHARFILAAYVVEAIFLTAGLAVEFGGFCLGSFIYHMLRGHGRFARQTLPWAENEIKYGVKGSEIAVGNAPSAKGDSSHAEISD
jgi:hypothetical protein